MKALESNANSATGFLDGSCFSGCLELEAQELVFENFTPGCLKSYEHLHLTLYPKLFNYALSFLKDRKSADNLVNEVFVELWIAQISSISISDVENIFQIALSEKIKLNFD